MPKSLPSLSLISTQEVSGLTHISKNEIRNNIIEIESKLSQMPGVMLGDCCPLKHSFADGSYIRQITMPKDMLFITKIHKITHPYFVLTGDVSVLTEEGVKRIKAPFSGITLAGTKRILYTHEETIWITVHVTKETDIKKIEEEIIAKSFDELDLNKIKNFIDVVNIEDKEFLRKGAIL